MNRRRRHERRLDGICLCLFRNEPIPVDWRAEPSLKFSLPGFRFLRCEIAPFGSIKGHHDLDRARRGDDERNER